MSVIITVNPLLSPPRAYLFQTHLRVGLIETGAYLRGVGGLFNLAKTMVSVLHKELEYQVEKFKYMNLEVMQEDQKQI